MKVLVAEDERHISALIVFKLKKQGYDVEAVEAGDAAVSALMSRPEQWSALILDVMLPKLDGWAVLSQIRNEPKLQKLAVIVLTARGQAEDVERARELGAARLLRKPFDPAELVDVLKEVIASVQAPSQAQSTIDWSDPELSAIRNEFIASLPERKKRVQSALEARDLEALLQVAHQTAGSADSFGLKDVAQSAEKLEQALGSGVWSDVLRAEAQQLIDTIDHFLRRMDSR